MHSKRSLIALIGFALLLNFIMLTATACKSNNPESRQVSDYFPGSIGSYWRYQGSGNEFASFSSEVVFGGDNLVQIKENNGGTMIDSVYEISDMQISRINYIPESYEKINYLNRQASQNIIILKMPLKPGQSWENTDDKREVVSVNASVDSPAGNFDNCIKIKISPQPASSTATTYEYYKQGVGLVKREFVSGNETISSMLEEYEINLH